MQKFAQPTYAWRPDSPSNRCDTLYEALRGHAQRDPQAVAMLAPGREPLSFGALIEQIDAVRATLHDRNFGPDDRIAVIGARGPDVAAAMLGVASHAVCAPLNGHAPPAETERALREMRAGALLMPTTAGDAMRELAARLGLVVLEYTSGARAGELEIAGGGRKSSPQTVPAAATGLAFVLRTSGTTNRSKIVPISQRNLVARIANTQRLLGLTPEDRCLSVMPLCYEHGLFSGLLGPLGTGGSVICAPDFQAEPFFACLREFEPTWYTGSFTYHHAIHDWLEQRPDAIAGHRLRFVRTSSGVLPERVRIGLERVLKVPIIEAYGSTETGTVAANRLDGLRKPGSAGKPSDDNVAILSEDGHVLPADTPGEVVLRGPRVFDGYDNDPEANARVFRHGWYHTGDHGFMDSDGYIRLLGRIDDVVNRGGEKIAPLEVDNVLLQHPAVALAVSFPIPHPRLGQELAAAVILRDGLQATESELRRFMGERLTAFKVPRRILVRADLPKGPTGKLSRKIMAEHFRLEIGDVAPGESDPSSGLLETLIDLWREVLNRSDVGADSNFFLAGGDSLMALDLLCRIEERLQYRLPLGALIEAPTPGLTELHLERSSFGAIDDTIRIHSAGKRRPLFVVSDRGGHVIRLLPLLHRLTPDQPCYGLQPPGLDWTNVGCTTVPEMARHYIGRLRAIQPTGPYRLFGPSFGGLVVFEMALQLEAAGERVEFLGVVDTAPPQCLFAEKNAPPIFMNAIPREDDGNSIEAINVRLAWSHVRARQSYVVDISSHRLAGAMTYFFCTGEPVQARHDRRRLWARLAPDGFRLVPIAGVHGTYHREPQLTSLHDALAEGLDACTDGRVLPTHSLSGVFDPDYRLLKRRGESEIIAGPAGKTYTVEQAAICGHVDAVSVDVDGMIVSGWALEPPQQPAQTVVAFFDGHYLGYGACGTLRADVARAVAPGLEYAGFQFRFRGDPREIGKGRPRLFVLSTDGTAAELNCTF